MATMSHDRSGEPRRVLVPGMLEMWASIAISTMWVAVTVDAIWGPNIVADTAGGDHTSLPSAVIVAVFAWLGTWSVAKHALHHPRGD
jgi:hypothetical protein